MLKPGNDLILLFPSTKIPGLFISNLI